MNPIKELDRSAHKQLLRQIIAAYDSPIIRGYCLARFTIINANILHMLSLCLRGKRRILDVGCGFGLFGCYFALRHPRLNYVGYDLNAARIDMARRAAERLALTNVRFDVADARALSLNDQFDAILTLDLLHHIDPDSRRGLLKMFRAHLRPGGRLVVKDVTRRPFHAMAFTWLLDVLMTRSFDMWYMSEADFVRDLGDAAWSVEMYPIADWLPYPHIVYLCQRGEEHDSTAA